MNVLIIEDEALAADKLEKTLLEIQPDARVVAKLDSVEEAVKWFMKHQADLIFLDIQLSDGLSFSIFEQVQVNTPIIFTTAYDQYSIKAFELNSVDYLLKPVQKEKLQAALHKFDSLRSAFQVDFQTLLQHMDPGRQQYKERFVVQAGMRIRKVDVKDIAYFYSLEKSTFLKTFKGDEYPLEKSLSALEPLLNPEHFFRINRKYILNMDAIDSMLAYSRARVKVVLKPDEYSGQDTVVSIDRAAAFREWLDT